MAFASYFILSLALPAHALPTQRFAPLSPFSSPLHPVFIFVAPSSISPQPCSIVEEDETANDRRSNSPRGGEGDPKSASIDRVVAVFGVDEEKFFSPRDISRVSFLCNNGIASVHS